MEGHLEKKAESNYGRPVLVALVCSLMICFFRNCSNASPAFVSFSGEGFTALTVGLAEAFQQLRVGLPEPFQQIGVGLPEFCQQFCVELLELSYR